MLLDKKILIITRHKEQIPKARLHLKFLRRLENYCKKYYLLDRDSLFGGKPLGSPTIKAEKWYKKYNPDIVIMYTSYGFDEEYLKNISCMKVMIETDFYKKKENNLQWYRKQGFDLLVKRGAHDRKYDCGIPMVWLPFSVDEKEFYPQNFDKRENIVGFAGSLKSPVYAQRRLAVERLKKAKLINLKGRRTKDYPKFVRSVTSFLTSAEVGTPHGKIFEVMSSGTALLSPNFLGKEELFGSKECFVEYKSDCSDVVKKAKNLLNNKQYAEEVAGQGRRVILQKHTHSKRMQELCMHLEGVLQGKSVEKPWGY